ncbi:MAG TPA: histidinol-phosphate transaminase [Pirellulales bacterium]|jgi:threonine-phosphate decarboxylase|nr:histidinol-phosphate transaminase [Pirellulales bacterium]
MNMLFPARTRNAPGEIVHGALDHRELAALGLSPDEVLDFSSNTNPFGPAPGVRAAVAGAPIDRYPDRDSHELRAALSQRFDLPVENILAGNGASELIWLTGLAFLQPGDAVLISGPTYGEYARAAQLAGAHPRQCTAQAADGFRVPCAAIDEALAEVAPRVVFICHPNNPTGTPVPLENLAAWAKRYRESLFIVDEAYLEFTAAPSALTLAAENVLVLRSMTKAYALAGLRLGFALGKPRLIEAMRRVRPPWSVNAMAQAAGIAALDDRDHLAASLVALAAAKRSLVANLAATGRVPAESATSFLLLDVGDAGRARVALLRRGLLVRDCASFGLPEYIRISVQRPENNDRLVAALREIH